MRCIQIIEFTTSRIDEMTQLMDEWLASTEGKRTASRAVLTSDRDKDGIYLSIVEFLPTRRRWRTPTSRRPRRSPESMAKLCDGPPVFRNLDVQRDEAS